MWDFEIFDKASRGPLGALMLLFRTKGRSLAALGALLIVLLLAIDTFFQQVIDQNERWTLHSMAGELPRTIQYTASSESIYRQGAEIATGDPDMALVIDKFSYGPGIPAITFGSSSRPEIPVVSKILRHDLPFTTEMYRLARTMLTECVRPVLPAIALGLHTRLLLSVVNAQMSQAI
jgi:hypothetical protein